jgi:hypothetical protein
VWSCTDINNFRNVINIIETKDEIQNRIREDINKLDNAQYEYIAVVFIEMLPTNDNNWRERTNIYKPVHKLPIVDDNTLQRIWRKGHFRVFLSHISMFKKETAILKQSLSRFGITSFVAHEDIEPNTVWQQEIESALFSMDALVALLTLKFHESNWTDQEVGVAIGRGIPLITIRLGIDPYGIMGKWQAVNECKWSNISITVQKIEIDLMARKICKQIFDELYKRNADVERAFEFALNIYNMSPSFDDSTWIVENILTGIKQIDSKQLGRIIDAFNNNSQNKDSFKGKDKLVQLLNQWTGKEWLLNKQRKLVSKN